jgi:hypothetical protein
MTKKKLGQLAMEILNTAEIDEDLGEQGIIQVNSDLLFQYYVMRNLVKKNKEKEAV